eukprot:2309323-Pleurochrysis_carterae.AAC.1
MIQTVLVVAHYTFYTLLRCACVRERALCDASRPLPALACAADDLEQTSFYASTDLDAEKFAARVFANSPRGRFLAPSGARVRLTILSGL